LVLWTLLVLETRLSLGCLAVLLVHLFQADQRVLEDQDCPQYPVYLTLLGLLGNLCHPWLPADQGSLQPPGFQGLLRLLFDLVVLVVLEFHFDLVVQVDLLHHLDHWSL